MSYKDELAEVENALRLLIQRIGLERVGVRAEDRRKWTERREQDIRDRGAGFPEDRPLYYADLGDLKRLIIKDANWALFEPALLNRAEAEVFLDVLRRLRNPEAHNREISSYEQSLAIGIAGELRTRITRYFSRMDTPDSFFPQLLSLQDSLGTVAGSQPTIRVGDDIEFVADAVDPLGGDLQYRFVVSHPGHSGPNQDWSSEKRFRWKVRDENISAAVVVAVYVRSQRAQHAFGDFDASKNFNYVVLPGRE